MCGLVIKLRSVQYRRKKEGLGYSPILGVRRIRAPESS